MRLRVRFKPLAIAAFLLGATPAVAQQACLQLESQLAAIDRGGAQQQYNQLNAQYQQQRAAYDATYRQAEQAGCIVVFRRFAPPQCTAILNTLDQRQAGVRQLEQALAAANPGQVNAQRDNILRALAANNCGPQYAAYGVQQGGRLLDRLFGAPINTLPYPGGVVPSVETFRTVCVRSCDGGFFPISFATTQAQFAADEATCQQQCPGAQLYVHRNPGGDMSTATNLAGALYATSPNAFLYQTAFNPTCGCHPGNGTTTTVAVTPYVPTAGEQLAALRSVVPVPLRRPEQSEDPETLANRAGGLTPGIGATPGEATVAGVSEGGIRLIGPAYYYAQ